MQRRLCTLPAAWFDKTITVRTGREARPMSTYSGNWNIKWPRYYFNSSEASWMLAEWTGLEPATPGVTGRYSNQLNYHSW